MASPDGQLGAPGRAASALMAAAREFNLCRPP